MGDDDQSDSVLPVEGEQDVLHDLPGAGVEIASRFVSEDDPRVVDQSAGDHRALLPACLLAGASALLGADIIARLALSAAELPIGVVTATLGAPVFIWLLLKSGRPQ